MFLALKKENDTSEEEMKTPLSSSFSKLLFLLSCCFAYLFFAIFSSSTNSM
jgi:hypothetical protein